MAYADIVASQWYLIAFSPGLIATVQFLSIKYGLKRFHPLYNALSDCGMRPSLRSLDFSMQILDPSPLGHGVQFVIALVTSYMTYRTVKNGIVEVDNDNSVSWSVIIMNVTTIVTILISKAACVCV